MKAFLWSLTTALALTFGAGNTLAAGPACGGKNVKTCGQTKGCKWNGAKKSCAAASSGKWNQPAGKKSSGKAAPANTKNAPVKKAPPKKAPVKKAPAPEPEVDPEMDDMGDGEEDFEG